MAHFAQLDSNNYVIAVHVVSNNDITDENGQESEEKGIAFLKEIHGQDTNWKQTSYNTRHGVHYQFDGVTPSGDQSKSFRKNYAFVGGKYDPELDAFIPIKPAHFPSFVVDPTIADWVTPVPIPADHFKFTGDVNKMYFWNEATLSWILPPSGTISPQ